MVKRTFSALLREARQHDDYWVQWIVSEFTEDLCRRMDSLGLSRTGFAHKINDSPAYVTKVLRGEENLTARSMAKLARAVGCVVRIHLSPVGTYGVWLDLGDGAVRKPIAATNFDAVAFSDDPGSVPAQVAPSSHGAGSTVGVTG